MNSNWKVKYLHEHCPFLTYKVVQQARQENDTSPHKRLKLPIYMFYWIVMKYNHTWSKYYDRHNDSIYNVHIKLLMTNFGSLFKEEKWA